MNSTLLSRRLLRISTQQRYASVLAPRYPDRDELSVWRNPLSKLKLQEKLDMDQFQKHHQRVVYQYVGASPAPQAPQLKSIDEYVLGLGPYRKSQHAAMPAIVPEVRRLESRVQRLGSAVEKIEKRAPKAASTVAAVAALVMGSGGGLYFYFA
ncbi:hypothetical protein LPJ78_002513 [Coemansia sp. RSA 989]|nr:hypothetical protein BX667DRAFT_508367 [Coemansia mojavensis]KAJ1742500.1 hypothetical protein LPJ68_001856 [Coemansia sp. RSA 1086]KAJ1749809.1 hypothetical protein LPJ79_003436 [Coemansia sp. RSA 1821]KAJ1865659.1 hypothetical protein LPJ78_002513 [Coemansia sp. RSA 989]KAJ1871886.1 hypothetical protein LPJ55_003520 [Coemansia sp. RSA 990]KAJ2633051.1 hypothetical protein H4R22_000771 [Coemansia sp. RSA 1290]KAJ2649583.1 hypothetical protein IWW40_003083 [Coemansia sp. RSA 1250]KAJ26696